MIGGILIDITAGSLPIMTFYFMTLGFPIALIIDEKTEIPTYSVTLREQKRAARGLSALEDMIDDAKENTEKEIQEVKNAYQAYDMLGRFDPYDITALKQLHGVMTYLTVQESGNFRSGNEGVFKGNRCIFMAPPPHLVPDQMDELFRWMREF